MAEEHDITERAFSKYLMRSNPPTERPQPGSQRWKDLRGAFMAGASFGCEAMATAARVE